MICDGQTDGRTDGQTDARGKTICLPTLKRGDIIIIAANYINELLREKTNNLDFQPGLT